MIELDPASRGGRSRIRRRDFLVTSATMSAAVALGGGLSRGVARAAPPASAGSMVCEIPGIGQFPILSYSWGADAGANAVTGSKVHDVSFVKYIDSFSAALSLACARGDQFTTAAITVPAKNGKSVRYEMTDVFVSAYVPGVGTGPGDATEHVSLSFARLHVLRR